MPAISIFDSLKVELVSASPQGKSGFATYLKGRLTRLIADRDFSSQLQTPLDQVEPGEHGLRLKFAQDVPLGVDRVAMTVAATSAVTMGVYSRPGMPLYEDAFIGPPLLVPADRSYMSLSIHPTLAVNLKPAVGNLSFGFESGTDVELRYYCPFESGAGPVPLGDACRELLETFAIPNTVDDLKAMLERPAGTIASISGHGRLEVGCAVNVTAALNPLASINTIAQLGTLNVAGSTSATVAVHGTVSGDFQMRVQTSGAGKIRLSYHHVASRELEVSLEASADAGVTLGDRDLLKMLLGGPGGAPDASEEELKAAGVSRAQVGKITAAMKEGLSRRLSLELSASLSSQRQDEAAFLYEIDVEGLDEVGKSAVNDALAGRLTALNRLEPALPGHGISVLQSSTGRFRKRQIKWRLNLIGLVNIISVSQLVRTGSVFHDEESGEIVITDKATSERIGATTRGKQLRKALFESVMLTVTYKAGGIDPNTSLAAAQTFFTMDRRANRQRMSDYLDAVVAMGLLPATATDARLGATDDFGRSSLLLEVEFDQAACERLFIADGQPHDQEFYEDIGKLAMLALVQKHDVDSYRRIPFENAALWQKMKNASTFSLKPLLPAPITGGDPVREAVQVEVVAADYTLIIWWATAMAAASRALADMRAFLAGPPAVTPDDTNPEFRRRRDAVARTMVKAVQRNRTTFGDDPWGLVAMFYASRRTASVTGALVSPRLTMLLPE